MAVVADRSASRSFSSERGSMLVQVAVALIVLIAFTGFVADHGLLYVGRRQAQNAADAAAHAGAAAFAFDDDDRSASGPAKQAAYRIALANGIAGAAPNVIDPTTGDHTDIVFHSEDASRFPPVVCDDNDCIRVDVYRNQERNNPLPVWFTQLIGVAEQGVRATAIARAAPAAWTNCLKPWLIPDKWEEVVSPATEFNYGENPGDPSDVYVNPGWTEADIGTQLVLKEGNPSTNDPIAPGDFYRIEEADTYEESITGCEIAQGIGDNVIIRPGNGVGPTKHGVEDLLAANNNEPVTVLVGMFDPAAFEALDRQSGTFEIQIVNMMGFRIEGYGPGNQVVGTIVAAPAEIKAGYENTAGNLLKKIMLIR